MLQPKLKVPPLQQIQTLAWQLQAMIDQPDGPVRQVLEQARADIREIAVEIYGE